MAYQKQTWRDYDDTKTELVNMNNGAVVTPERMNHIETGIANSADKQEVTAQLAQKANQEEVFLKVYGININDFDEPTRQTFLEQQGIDVNYVLGKGNVKLDNVTFVQQGKNLFNKDIVLTNTLLTTSGSTTSNASYSVMDYLEILPSSSYAFTGVRSYAWYDETKTFINYDTIYTNTSIVISPENASFLRMGIANENVPLAQLEQSDVATPYEPYRLYIPKKYTEKHPFEPNDIADRTIGAKKTSFISSGKNLFNPETASIGYNVNTANGTLAANSNYDSSDFIEINANTSYVLNATASSRVAFYDEHENFISALTSITNPIVTPSNAKYLRFAFPTGYASARQLEKGEVVTHFEPYGYRLDKQLPSRKDVELILPKKIYVLVGQELNIYFDNIINDEYLRYDFDVTCSIGKHLERGFRVTPNVSGTFPIEIKAFQEGKEIAVATSEVIVSAKSVGDGITKKTLIIGDSTTDSGIATSKLLENFNTDVMNVELIGTRGSGANLHEGRSGWNANLYVTTEQSGSGMVNAFYNSTSNSFDFTYYMNSNEFTSVDYVVINLGVNDMFNGSSDEFAEQKAIEVLNDYQTMINSIKSFNANIKIGLAVAIPPNYNQDAFGKAYGNGQNRWRYKRNNLVFAKKLIELYSDREDEGLYLVPINTNLDTKYNMGVETIPVNARNTEITIQSPIGNGGVHPVDSGYWQIADVYWYWLKSFEV